MKNLGKTKTRSRISRIIRWLRLPEAPQRPMERVALFKSRMEQWSEKHFK